MPKIQCLLCKMGGGKRLDECLFTHRVGGNETKVVYSHTKSYLNNG